MPDEQYAVIHFDGNLAKNVAVVVNSLNEALRVIAEVRTNKGVPGGIFKKLDGRIVYGAQFIPADQGANQTSRKPVRKAAKLPPVDEKPGKRTARQIATLRTRILKWLASNPGSTVEVMSEALKVPTKDLSVPVKQLLDGKKLRKRGQRRATRYYRVKEK